MPKTFITFLSYKNFNSNYNKRKELQEVISADKVEKKSSKVKEKNGLEIKREEKKRHLGGEREKKR